MPDWRGRSGGRLAPFALRPTREIEIVEEIAQHLEDRFIRTLCARRVGRRGSRGRVARAGRFGCARACDLDASNPRRR